MNDGIKVSRGEVTGIGKVKIPRTGDFDYEIQPLAFLSIKEGENSFISTCIHVRIDGYGKTEEAADINMVKNVSVFLSRNFSGPFISNAWDNLRELFRSDDWSDELWTAYHEFQIRLSMKGQQMMDPAAEIFSNLALLAQREKELQTLAGELEKIRTDLDSREAALKNDIEIMGRMWAFTKLISKMPLYGSV